MRLGGRVVVDLELLELESAENVWVLGNGSTTGLGCMKVMMTEEHHRIY